MLLESILTDFVVLIMYFDAEYKIKSSIECDFNTAPFVGTSFKKDIVILILCDHFR